MSYVWINFEFPTQQLFHKQILWTDKDCNVYFAFKKNINDAWTWYSGNGSHALETGRLLTQQDNEANAQTNYLTTDRNSNGKTIAILPSVIQAKYARLYIEEGDNVQLYEWRPSTYFTADEIVSGELHITNALTDAPIIRVTKDSVDRVKIGNIVGTAYGIAGYNDSAATIFELSDAHKTIAGWDFTSTRFSSNDVSIANTGRIKAGSGDNIVQIDSQDATYRLWVGDATAADAPFRVTKEGKMYADGAEISGTLAASSITTRELATRTITHHNIVINTLTATEFAASCITANKIRGGDFGILNLSSGQINITATKGIIINTASGLYIDADAGVIVASLGYIKIINKSETGYVRLGYNDYNANAIGLTAYHTYLWNRSYGVTDYSATFSEHFMDFDENELRLWHNQLTNRAGDTTCNGAYLTLVTGRTLSAGWYDANTPRNAILVDLDLGHMTLYGGGEVDTTATSPYLELQFLNGAIDRPKSWAIGHQKSTSNLIITASRNLIAPEKRFKLKRAGGFEILTNTATLLKQNSSGNLTIQISDPTITATSGLTLKNLDTSTLESPRIQLKNSGSGYEDYCVSMGANARTFEVRGTANNWSSQDEYIINANPDVAGIVSNDKTGYFYLGQVRNTSEGPVISQIKTWVLNDDDMSDDVTASLPSSTMGLVFVNAYGNSVHADGVFSVLDDGTVHKLVGKNATSANADGYLCCYDAGAYAAIRNTLGGAAQIRIVYHYN